MALAEQKVKHRQLGQILIELGYITQVQLTEALAIQAGIERVDLSDVSIGGEIIGLVPADIVSKYNILPLWRQNGRLAVAMTDPFQPQMMEDLRLVTGCLIQRFYAEPSQLEHAVLKFYGSNVARMLDNLAPAEQRGDENSENGDFSPARLSELAREPSLVNLVNLIIFEAIESRASDIHIEPFEREVKIKYRVDGILVEKAPSSKRLHAAIISRIKIMANMNIAERFVPQDGHIEFTGKKGRIDIRVSTVPTVWGEGVALRLLDRSASLIQSRRSGHERPIPGGLLQVPQEDARNRPGHRADGIRQDDDALRRAQQDLLAGGQDDHDRGPRRVPARRASTRCPSIPSEV